MCLAGVSYRLGWQEPWTSVALHYPAANTAHSDFLEPSLEEVAITPVTMQYADHTQLNKLIKHVLDKIRMLPEDLKADLLAAITRPEREPGNFRFFSARTIRLRSSDCQVAGDDCSGFSTNFIAVPWKYRETKEEGCRKCAILGVAVPSRKQLRSGVDEFPKQNLNEPGNYTTDNYMLACESKKAVHKNGLSYTSNTIRAAVADCGYKFMYYIISYGRTKRRCTQHKLEEFQTKLFSGGAVSWELCRLLIKCGMFI